MFLSRMKWIFVLVVILFTGALATGCTVGGDDDDDDDDNDDTGVHDDDDDDDDNTGENVTCFQDLDEDGYGDPAQQQEFEGDACPDGWVNDSQDCNDDPDNNGQIQYPGNSEVCDGLDNDCAGGIDDSGDALCDNGMYCDGAETCDGVDGCTAGSDPCVDDDVFCNGDEVCNETADSCDHTGDPCVDDNVFCNGEVSCNESAGSCDHTGDPCTDDNVFCNGDEYCNETSDLCGHTGDPCVDDDIFCNGEEYCEEASASCEHEGNPCEDDEVFCNGEEICREDLNGCLSEGNPCTFEEFCAEYEDECWTRNWSYDFDEDTLGVAPPAPWETETNNGTIQVVEMSGYGHSMQLTGGFGAEEYASAFYAWPNPAPYEENFAIQFEVLVTPGSATSMQLFQYDAEGSMYWPAIVTSFHDPDNTGWNTLQAMDQYNGWTHCQQLPDDIWYTVSVQVDLDFSTFSVFANDSPTDCVDLSWNNDPGQPLRAFRFLDWLNAGFGGTLTVDYLSTFVAP